MNISSYVMTMRQRIYATVWHLFLYTYLPYISNSIKVGTRPRAYGFN